MTDEHGYTTIRLPDFLIKQIDDFVKDKQNCYRSRNEFCVDGVRRFILHLRAKNGNKDYQPKHEGKMETSLEGGEENPKKGGDMHGNRKEEKIQNMDETGGRMDEKQLS